jgi:ketosteroid isomerase-like protein
MSNADTARTVFDAYLAQDRDTMDRLLADEFVFTSPQDDHIDKATFFQRCFPTAGAARHPGDALRRASGGR